MSAGLIDRAARLFAERFGERPADVSFAPGRVNLIGEHVDYNDGLVLPMAVPGGTAVAWSPLDGDMFEVFAADFGEEDQFTLTPEQTTNVDWRSYVRGMVAQSGLATRGLRLVIAGDLARGSGLSSSASLCIAIGRALAEASGQYPSQVDLARAAQRTEHDWAGVACGIMDQMAVAAGEPGHAMLLDCRTLDFSNLMLPADWAVLVTHSGVTRGLVDGEYNARRAQCEAAAKAMGVSTLRDATMAQIEAARLDNITHRRARHVVAEIARTRAAAEALQSGNLPAFGAVLREGHASLRELFEVSVPAVDTLVDKLQSVIGPEGGARMTGGGFGGSVVAVLAKSRVEQLVERTGIAFQRVF